jgi:hypothetical protein
MVPMFPLESTAETEHIADVAAVGVPVRYEFPASTDVMDNPAGRPVAKMDAIVCVPEPNTVSAEKRYALVLGTETPVVSVGR